jgi:hypothetical protein
MILRVVWTVDRFVTGLSFKNCLAFLRPHNEEKGKKNKTIKDLK